jgi:hypothetical protein
MIELVLRFRTLKAEERSCFTHCTSIAVSAEYSVASSAGSVVQLKMKHPS